MMSTTESRARQLLESVEEVRTQVARLQRNVRNLEERCTAITPRYGFTGGGTRTDYDRLPVELADQRSLLIAEQQKLKALTDTVEQWIALLPRPRWRMVLRYHYLEGYDLQDTCTMLSQAAAHSFSMSQIYRLHRQALLAAEELWPLSSPGTDVPTGCGSFPGTPAVTVPPKPAFSAIDGPQSS